MDVPQEVYDLTLLFDMRTQEGPKKHVNFHFIGNVHLRNGPGSIKRRETISFRNNTLNAKCNLGQLIRDIMYAGLTWLLSMKVEGHQLPTCLATFLQTSSPTSGGPLAPSGSFVFVIAMLQ